MVVATMQMVTVEDREAEADQRYFERFALVAGVALDVLAIGVADQEVRLVREAQAAHVPQVIADIHLAIDAKRAGGEQLLDRLAQRLLRCGTGWVGSAPTSSRILTMPSTKSGSP
jgi:hypothetical protein